MKRFSVTEVKIGTTDQFTLDAPPFTVSMNVISNPYNGLEYGGRTFFNAYLATSYTPVENLSLNIYGCVLLVALESQSVH